MLLETQMYEKRYMRNITTSCPYTRMQEERRLQHSRGDGSTRLLDLTDERKNAILLHTSRRQKPRLQHGGGNGAHDGVTAHGSLGHGAHAGRDIDVQAPRQHDQARQVHSQQLRQESLRTRAGP